jgi:DNA replication protein DnaC
MHAGEVLEQLVNQAVKENQAPYLFLDRILKVEQTHRDERRIATSLRLSGLPPGMTLGNFDFGFQPGSRKARSRPWPPAPGSGPTRRFSSRDHRA